jgi:hypothetical protein
LYSRVLLFTVLSETPGVLADPWTGAAKSKDVFFGTTGDAER